jgi:hypothetical protein
VQLFDPIQKYLGLEIELQSNGDLHLHQSTYIGNIDLYEQTTKSPTVPMNPNVNLNKSEQDETLDILLPVTGTLMHALKTRKDLSFAVSAVASNGTPHPSQAHVDVAKQIVSYMKNTKDAFIKISGNESKKQLFAFTDASLIKDGDSKSQLGGALFYGYSSGAFSVFSGKAKTVALSAMDAEILAMERMIKDIIFFKDILLFLNEDIDPTTTILIDAKNAKDLFESLRSNHATRHMNVRINYIRQEVESGNVKFEFIPSESNVADMLTKALSTKLFQQHSENLMHGFNGSIEHLLHFNDQRPKTTT